jgi:hypothetical protein
MLLGGDGSDRIAGEGVGSNVAQGGAGNDKVALVASGGGSTVGGGEGNDSVTLESIGTTGNTVTGGDGVDKCFVTGADGTIAECEKLNGGPVT